MKKMVKKAQNGATATGVRVSKADEKKHPEDFKYLTAGEKMRANKAKAVKAIDSAKAAAKAKKAPQAKSGGNMKTCRGGC